MLYYAQNFCSLQSIISMKNYNDMALALAGVCQSVLLISQLAQKGEVDNQDAFQTTIHSLLITQPEDTLAVFGGDVQHLKVGLNTLIEQLTQLNDKNLLNYWGSLLALESKLNKNLAAVLPVYRNNLLITTINLMMRCFLSWQIFMSIRLAL